MSTTLKTLYDADLVEWADVTAELLRAGRLDEIDIDNLAEEIEGLSSSHRSAVRSQLRRMLMHMIKQRVQPERDGASWGISILNARVEILDELADAPSLRGFLKSNLETIYASAVALAIREMELSGELPEDTALQQISEHCPYTLDELLEPVKAPRRK